MSIFVSPTLGSSIPENSLQEPLAYITQKEFEKHMKGRVWLASHGGVASEYLTEQLGIHYPKIRIQPHNKPLVGCIAHYPTPVKGMEKVIYVFGDIYNSILSQIPRHPWNPSKLHNNVHHRYYMTPTQLLKEPSSDPFGIGRQFKNFMSRKVSYPILFIKYGSAHKNASAIFKFLGKQEQPLSFRERSSDWTTQPSKIRRLLQNKYQNINQIMNEAQELLIRYPSSTQYPLSTKDVQSKQELDTKVKIQVLNKHPFVYPDSKDQVQIQNYTEIVSDKGTISCFNLLEQDPNDSSNTFCSLYISENNAEYKLISAPCIYSQQNKGSQTPLLFAHQNTPYILAQAFKSPTEKGLFLYNITKKQWIEIKHSTLSSLIEHSYNPMPYSFEGKLYFVISLSPLNIICLDDISKGTCQNTSRSKGSLPGLIPTTPLIAWDYPHLVGFAKKPASSELIPYVFDAKNQKLVIQKKPLSFLAGLSLSDVYHVHMKGDQVRIGLNTKTNGSTLLHLDFQGFCKAFAH